MFRYILLLCLFIIQIIGSSCATNRSPPLSPILSYQKNDHGQIEHVLAVIKKSNLDQGSGVSKNAREQLKPFSLHGDDAGHLIGNRLGGTGKKNYNLVPQNLGVNRGAYREMEDEIYKEVKKTGQRVTMHVRPKYDSKLQQRPSAIDVTAIRHDGSLLTKQSFPNDKYNKPYKPSLSKSLPDLRQIGSSSSNTQRISHISQSPIKSTSNSNINKIGSNLNIQRKRQRPISPTPPKSVRGRGRGGLYKFSSRRRS
ncbi:hypothetical protein O3M35_010347 [Rhynocoris fuscipes]|uniref:Type VII secretion system protein EssD-like domain-containing protein n=1 Tax=Rhynocoris fuscipes TaxID=488301 RepID=A0AAW1CZJ3_9HEMI